MERARGQDEKSFDEDLNMAAKLHRYKLYEEAAQIYHMILAKDPKHGTLDRLGINAGDSHHLLGALLLDMHGLEKFEEAKQHLLSAISSNPRNPRYRQSLGVAYQRNGNKLEAVECLERANEKDPMNTQILMQLGRLLKDTGRFQRAAEVYRAVTLLEPDHPMAHYRAAAQFRSLGRYEQALVHFRQHLRLFQDHSESKFWIAALTGDTAAAKAAPPACVASLFDQYSEHFDKHLVTQLGYRTPQLLMNALLSAAYNTTAPAPGPLPPTWARCVDLGVGTGLMGPLLRAHVAPGGLEGVDLSSGMIAKARAEGRGYDKLQVGELVQYLHQAAAQSSNGPAMGTEPCDPATTRPEDGSIDDLAGNRIKGAQLPLYECVVAADVFVYLGDLKPVLSAAATVCKKGALLAFSVEASEPQRTRLINSEGVSSQPQGSRPSAEDVNCSHIQHEPYSLLPTGRYVHTAQYLRDALAGAEWCVSVLTKDTLRYNGGQPVVGHLCVAVRS